MDEKQLGLIQWMYNFCVTEMKLNPEKFEENDEKLLADTVKRRFPEHAEQITKPF